MTEMMKKEDLIDLVKEVMNYYEEDDTRVNCTKYAPQCDNTVGCAVAYVLVNKYGFDSNNLTELDTSNGGTGCGILDIKENEDIVEKFPKLKQMFSEIPLKVLVRLQSYHDRLSGSSKRQSIIKSSVLTAIDESYV